MNQITESKINSSEEENSEFLRIGAIYKVELDNVTKASKADSKSSYKPTADNEAHAKEFGANKFSSTTISKIEEKTAQILTENGGRAVPNKGTPDHQNLMSRINESAFHNAAGKRGSDRENYKKLLQEPLPVSITEGISILRPKGKNTATVLFDGDSLNDIVYLYIPGSVDSYVKVIRATSDVTSVDSPTFFGTAENGVETKVENTLPGQIIIPKGVVYHRGENGYCPAKPTENEKKCLDKFNVKAVSVERDSQGKEVDTTISMTTLFKGEVLKDVTKSPDRSISKGFASVLAIGTDRGRPEDDGASVVTGR